MRSFVAALCVVAAVAGGLSAEASSCPELIRMKPHSHIGNPIAREVIGLSLKKVNCMMAPSTNRRLQGMPGISEISLLPAACSAACPGMQSVLDRLNEKMMKILEPEMKKMEKKLRGGGEQDFEAIMEEMLAGVKRALPKILEATFDDMCSNRQSYACMSSTEACAEVDVSMGLDEAGGLLGNSSWAQEDFERQLGCFCDTCPKTKQLYVDASMASLTFVTAMMEGEEFEEFVGDEAAMQDAFCPLILGSAEVESCFEAHPAECDASLDQLSADFDFSSEFGDSSNATNATEDGNLTAWCDGWTGAARPVEVGIAAVFLTILAQLTL